MGHDIEREVVDGAGPNDIDVRLYDDTTRPEVPRLPSVTTILKTRDDDKSNLYDWQDRNDGEGDNAHHEHLFWYSRHVGTLGHWHALSQLDDLDWSSDEQQSKLELQRLLADEVKDTPPRKVLYSILRGDRDKAGGTVQSWGEFYDKYPPYKRGDYYRNHIVSRAEDDISFFADAQQRLWSKVGVSPLNVIAVEQFLFNDTHGYAGQVDLVYEDSDGHIVVADLKSSSGCYDKHQIQGAAYAKAVELYDGDNERLAAIDTVDRLEVHRAHPRTGQMAVHTHRDAPGKSSVHTTKYWSDGYEALWDDFERLINNFESFTYN